MRRIGIALIALSLIVGVLATDILTLRNQNAFAGGPGTNGAGSNAAGASGAGGGGASASTAPSAPDDESTYVMGVWREGKAVDTDIAFLDLFLRDYLRRGYKPEQPIKYNHQLHIEKNKMECQYCHSGVAKSGYATLPSVELCMGCHKSVKTDSPEIKKLKEFYDKNESVPWVPVNNLPEHVRFTHKRHIKAGVGCHTCHGQIQKMPVVEKMASLKMGFCVSCHRENGASIDCSTCHY